MNRHGIHNCVTETELAQLFNDAFETWHACAANPDGSRQAPRVIATDAKPLFVVSYAFDGQDFPVCQGAAIADISADGLGIILPMAIPIDATLRFAFENPSGESGSGVASVARVARHEDGYLIGLTFEEQAGTLNVDESSNGAQAPARWTDELVGVVVRAATRAFRVAICRRNASRTLVRTIDGREACFVIDAKLFRYTATLHVDGRREAAQTGTLRDRLLNLVSNRAFPTMIHIEGGGFSAWATLRPNAVLNCTLEQSVGVRGSGFLRPIPELPPAKPGRRKAVKTGLAKVALVASQGA